MDFLNITPRERAGSSTAARYDYQKDIAICMLLEYHETHDDYLFVFDYHDDLVVLDSEVTPNKYAFFQIKSKKSGSWTLKSILKRKDGQSGEKLNSILGKLFLHTKNFPLKVQSLNLISNSPYSVKENGKSTVSLVDEICLQMLDKNEIQFIETKISEEFKPEIIKNVFIKFTFLKAHRLSLRESSTHAKGKLSEFLNKRTNGKKYNVEFIYRSIYDEVKIKNNCSDNISSFEDLKSRKSIGKTDFDAILKLIGERKDYDSIWQDVNTHLVSANIKFGDIKNYKSKWKQIEIERMNPVNRVLRECITDIANATKELESGGKFTGMNIIESAELVSIKISFLKRNYPFDEQYIKAIIFAEMYD